MPLRNKKTINTKTPVKQPTENKDVHKKTVKSKPKKRLVVKAKTDIASKAIKGGNVQSSTSANNTGNVYVFLVLNSDDIWNTVKTTTFGIKHDSIVNLADKVKTYIGFNGQLVLNIIFNDFKTSDRTNIINLSKDNLVVVYFNHETSFVYDTNVTSNEQQFFYLAEFMHVKQNKYQNNKFR